MINRKTPPDFRPITELPFPDLETYTLANGQPLYGINTGTQPAFKLEIIFNAGSKFHPQESVVTLISKMLLGGTSNYTSFELAEQFDQYGGFTEVSQNAEQLSFTLYGLTHHLEKFLPLIIDVFTNCNFPDDEFSTQKQIATQNLLVNLEKTAFVANQTFKATLFGDEHPLGQFASPEDIKNVEKSVAEDFYNNYIQNQPFDIFLSGQFTAEHIELIDKYLGSLVVASSRDDIPLEYPKTTSKKLLIEKNDSLQSTIRMGRTMFTRKHPDYFPFLITNAVFGGYFGSRLMKNIREEKGFTYGISSSFIPMKSLGYFLIGTDVKREFTQQTLDEITKEIEILRNETVSENELTTVKNYLVGSVAGSVNNAFDIADKYKMLVREGLTKSYYHDFIQNINAVTPQDVQDMANKYLHPANLTEVVVGGK